MCACAQIGSERVTCTVLVETVAAVGATLNVPVDNSGVNLFTCAVLAEGSDVSCVCVLRLQVTTI